MDKMNDRDIGIMYVATGRKYIREAVASASSVSKCMPDVPITLWTDAPGDIPANVFGEVRKIVAPTLSFFDKILPLCQTPYRKTLFLDTDTLVLDGVYELFSILDKFEIAYCHAPFRGSDNPPVTNCPASFVEPNTGVIAYCKTEAVVALFQKWSDLYAFQLKKIPTIKHDQPAFRQVLYDSDVRSLVLPPEYNIRTPLPVFAGWMKVKILHGREPSLSRAKNKINKELQVRIFDFEKPNVAKRIIKRILPKRLLTLLVHYWRHGKTRQE